MLCILRDWSLNPRDFVCRVNFYPLKEDIMRKARSIRKVVFDNTQI